MTCLGILFSYLNRPSRVRYAYLVPLLGTSRSGLTPEHGKLNMKRCTCAMMFWQCMLIRLKLVRYLFGRYDRLRKLVLCLVVVLCSSCVMAWAIADNDILVLHLLCNCLRTWAVARCRPC